MSGGARFNRGKSRQDWGTPSVFIDAVEARFGRLDWDLAAHAGNAKAPRYITQEDLSVLPPEGTTARWMVDSLTVDWSKLDNGTNGERITNCWLNPPFDNIEKWVDEAAETFTPSTEHVRLLILVPASVGANWFIDHVWGCATHIVFLNGRLTFEGCDKPYPKDCMLLVYGAPLPELEGPYGVSVWPWRKQCE